MSPFVRKPRPIDSARSPSYPTELAFAAVASLAMTVLGCGASSAKPPTPPPPAHPEINAAGGMPAPYTPPPPPPSSNPADHPVAK